MKIKPTIQSVLIEKNARTKVQQKIDSRLLQAVREKSKRNNARSGQVNIKADKGENVQVDIKAEVTEALNRKIKALGGIILYASKEYRAIRAEIKLSMVEKIAAFPEIVFIEPAVMMQLDQPLNPIKTPQVPGVDPALPVQPGWEP